MGKSSRSSGIKNFPGTTISSPDLSQTNISEKDISTSDAFKKLERQNEILLFICEEITRIRGKKDMQHIIQNTIKQYVPFDDSIILRYNKNSRTARIYIYHAEKHELEDPGFRDQLNYEYPVENDNLDATPFPVVHDATLLLKTYRNNASFIDCKNVKEYVCVKLIEGDNLIGFLLLFSEQKNLLKPDDLNLLQRISYQISIATANIIANEEIAKREEEKTILLSLSYEIAATTNRADFFEIVSIKLKALFGIKEFGIAQINADGTTYDAFVLGLENEVKAHADYEKITGARYMVSDPVFSNVINSKDPVMLDVHLLAEETGLPAYVGFWKNIGLSYVLGIALRVGGKNVGCAFLHIDKENTVNIKNTLLKGVCAQLAVKISNILATEEIAKREEEKTILLSLSNEIAAIKNRSDFFEVVNTQLKILFGIKEFGIAQIGSDGTTYDAFVLELEDKVKGHTDYEKITGDSYLVSDPVFSRIMNSEDPVQLDVNLLSEEIGVPAYVEFWKKVGLTYVFGIALRVGGINVGCAFLHVDKNHTIDIKNTLLKSVCAQIAAKVSNILANEEIGKREEEKSILLSFSNEIADIRNRNDFFEVVVAKIKNIFAIQRFSIAKVNEDGTTFSAFRLDASGNEKDLPDYDDIVSADYPFTDGVFGSAITSEEPVLFDVNQLDDGPGDPAYIRYWKRIGLRYLLIVALRTGGNHIGFALLYFNSKDGIDIKSTLLKGICAQLAAKISTILADEEIVKREEEKSILLSFSNEIADIRNRNDFFEVVIAKIKNIFAIERFSIAKVNEHCTTFSAFTLDITGIEKVLPVYNDIISADYPFTRGVFGFAITSEEPVLFDVNQLDDGPGSPTYIRYWKRLGFRYVLIVALRAGGNYIGFALLYFNSKDRIDIKSTLLKGICAQLAVKVSQILANEELEKREREKSMLLAFSNALASERDKNALAKILNQQLKALFYIEDYVIYALSDDKKTHYPILFDPDADFAKHTDFSKLLDHLKDVNDGVLNTILASSDPVTFNAEEWYDSKNPPTYVDAATATGLKKMISMRLQLAQENIGLLNFRQNELNEHAIRGGLFKSICSQIAINLANIIANEKINKQLNEINKYKEQLEEEKIYLKEEIENSMGSDEIVGESMEIKKVFRMVAQVGYSDSTVLLLGETGTGKELVARAIHNLSPRKNKLMIKVNCAAMPANLIESELFGHERGSFTGATERRIGKFELANNGTLFLDEIGEMPLDLQVKLLRALQEKEIERVGGRTTIKTDARIITATNRDLEKLMDEGKFRRDLYYRLNTFPIMIPPLRSRSEDIPKLALYFIERYSKKTGKKIKSISNKALQELMRYDWPGNIRELEHLIERGVLLATGDSINEIHLPHQVKTLTSAPDTEDVAIKTIDENEREYILKILKYVKGRIGGKGGAAELLGLPTSTLNSRIKKLGIRREHIG